MTKVLCISLLFLFLKLYSAQKKLTKVKISSLTISDKNVQYTNRKFMYDNRVDTRGSFMASTPGMYNFDFDLAKDYVVSKIEILTHKNNNLSIAVGNMLNEKGGLDFSCKIKGDRRTCIPSCVDERPGVFSRNIRMKIQLLETWIDVYEVEVYYGKDPQDPNQISDRRVVLPDNCNLKSWLLTDKDSNTLITQDIGTQIYLEKAYVTDVLLVSAIASVKMLGLSFTSEYNTESNKTIDLSACSLTKSLYTCKFDFSEFGVRVITIKTAGITKLVAQGRLAFYPTVEIVTDNSNPDLLKFACKIRKCNINIHPNCSDKYVDSGVKFACINKRLLRLPTDKANKDEFIIVNNAKVNSHLDRTQFKVESDDDKQMTVSMPKSYQYYGNYKCGCIVSDRSDTEIQSQVTSLKRKDFVKDELGFNWLVQYRLKDDQQYENVSNKIIVAHKNELPASYIILKAETYSILAGNVLHYKYLTNPEEAEELDETSYSEVEIPAFPDLLNGWTVKVYKYQVLDMYPEFMSYYSVNFTLKSMPLKKNETYSVALYKIEEETQPVIFNRNTNDYLDITVVFVSTEKTEVSLETASCLGTNVTSLGSFSNSGPTNSNLMTIKQSKEYITASLMKPRQLSSDYKFKVGNQSIMLNKKLNLKEGDVSITTKIIKLSKPTGSDSIKAKVELDINSQVLNDYIKCGIVKTKVVIPGAPGDESILSLNRLTFDLMMQTNSLNIQLEISIEKSDLKLIKNITILNPVKSAVTDVEFSGGVKPMLRFTGINSMAVPVLDHYLIEVKTTVIACNLTLPTKTYKVQHQQNIIKHFQYMLDPLNKHYSVDLAIDIFPKFGDLSGKRVSITHQNIIKGKTEVEIMKEPMPSERGLIIYPRQKNLPCPIKMANFTINSVFKSNSQVQLSELKDANKYKLINLIPGRIYRFRAQVVYGNGDKDEISKEHEFETTDEILLDYETHVIKPNEQLNLTCRANVGPAGDSQKKVEWKRYDKSQLPHGVLSEPDPNDPGVAYLIVNKALVDHSLDYGCFVKPKATYGGVAKLQLIVNDLSVEPSQQKVVFSKTSKPLKVVCSTLSVSKDLTLNWIAPSGNMIISNDTKYTIEKQSNPRIGTKSILTISEISLDSSGTYLCQKALAGIKSNVTFLMYGSGNLTIKTLDDSSKLLSEKSKFRCEAEPQVKGQKLVWKAVPSKSNLMVSRTQPEVLNTDVAMVNDYQIKELKCLLSPAAVAGEELVTKSTAILLDSSIKVTGPGQNVLKGSDVTLQCTGYPSKPGQLIQWVYFEPNSTVSARQVIKTIDRPSADKYDANSQPLSLNLTLEKVNTNRSGSYQCHFVDDYNPKIIPRSAPQQNTINLVIAAARSSKVEDGSKSAQSLRISSWIYVVVVLVTLLSTIRHPQTQII